MLKSSLTTHQAAALACSFTLHAGLLAWIAWPRAVIETQQQQVVDISVVMLSSFAPAAGETSPPAPVEEVSAPDTGEVHPNPKQHSTHLSRKRQSASQQAAATPLTTGPQAPHATEKVAALTEPVFNAAYLHNTPPAYPEEARRDGIEGKVLLDVAVTQQGAAQEVNVRRSSGYALLDYAARNAVRQWRFVPAHRGNEIVEARVIVPVEFRLE